jgi:predicted flavoprotein YhiN
VLCFNQKKDEKIEVSVFDLNGKEVYETTYVTTGGITQIKIDHSKQVKGNYILKLDSQSSFITKPLILQ